MASGSAQQTSNIYSLKKTILDSEMAKRTRIKQFALDFLKIFGENQASLVIFGNM